MVLERRGGFGVKGKGGRCSAMQAVRGGFYKTDNGGVLMVRGRREGCGVATRPGSGIYILFFFFLSKMCFSFVFGEKKKKGVQSRRPSSIYVQTTR